MRNDGEFEIGPASELQKKYGLYAENRPAITVDPSEVPDDLRFLIPSVERWAIPCDITRLDYIDKQPKDDVRAFHALLAPHRDRINEWLDTFPQDTALWPRAAIHFLYVLVAHDDAYEMTPEEIRKRDEAWEVQTRPKRLKQASLAAADAFRARKLREVIELLSPFEPYLAPSDRAKLAHAKKQEKGTQ